MKLKIPRGFSTSLAVQFLTLAAIATSWAGGNTITWTGNSASTSVWSDAGNWSPGIPANGDDVLFIGNFKMTPTDDIPSLSLTQLIFPANAFRDFVIHVSPGGTLAFSGAGTQNNSAFTQTFNVDAGSGATNGGLLNFINNASAGNVHFITSGSNAATGLGGTLQFDDQSTAGTADITNEGGGNSGNGTGHTIFNDTATAGSSMIHNLGGTTSNSLGGTTEFHNDSTAGAAVIVSGAGTVMNAFGGDTHFYNTSGAGTANITQDGGASASAQGALLQFADTSSAEMATITNNAAVANATAGATYFYDSATAGSASILNNGASAMNSDRVGATDFFSNATAGGALITNTGGSAMGAVGGLARFDDDSNAGTANFVNEGGTADGSFGGSTEFYVNSSAANATVTNSGSAVMGARGGFVLFTSNTTAGSAMISNNPGTNGGGGGEAAFNGFAKGGTSTIINFGSATPGINTAGITDFSESSDAQMATIENRAATAANGVGGVTIFEQNPTAGSATITNFGAAVTGSQAAGRVFFNAGMASAGSSMITNNGGTVSGSVGGSVQFQDAATAGSATLINNGSLYLGASGLTQFYDGTTAASATLISNGGLSGGPGGRIQFFFASLGGTSRVQLNGNGLLDISQHTAPGVSIGSLEGQGDVFLGGNNLTVGTNNMSTTFSGFIAEGAPDGGGNTGGSLTKTGTGTLIFSGGASYTGPTSIDAGIFQLDGNIMSTTTVSSGGTLAGSGTIMSASLINNGIVSPGPGSSGGAATLTVGGGYSQASSATLRIEIGGLAAGQHDLLSVGTNASLGGTLQLLRLNNFTPQNGDAVTILTTGGTVMNQFSNVTDNFPGLIQPEIDYSDPTQVRVIFAVGSFTGVEGLTPNQLHVAENLDRVVNDPRAMALIDFLAVEPEANLPHDYDLIAPEELASIYEIGFSQATIQNNNLVRRMDDIRAGSNGFCANGFVPRTQDYSKSSDGKATIADSTVAPSFIPCPDNRWGIFAIGTGDFVDVGNNDSNAHGYDITTGNFTAGVDYRIGEHFAVGIDGGYAGSRAELVDRGRVDVDGGKIGAYATFFGKGLLGSTMYVDVAGNAGWNNYDTRRTGLDDTTTMIYNDIAYGSTEGGEFNLLLAYGSDWTFGCFNVGTWSTLQYSRVDMDGFTEEGSLAPLHIQGQDHDSFRATTGLHASYDWKFGKCGIVRPEVRAGWQHEYEDRAYAVDASLASGAGDVFRVHGPNFGRDAALVGAGVNVHWNARFSTGIYYDGVLGRSNYDNNAVSGSLAFSF